MTTVFGVKNENDPPLLAVTKKKKKKVSQSWSTVKTSGLHARGVQLLRNDTLPPTHFTAELCSMTTSFVAAVVGGDGCSEGAEIT